VEVENKYSQEEEKATRKKSLKKSAPKDLLISRRKNKKRNALKSDTSFKNTNGLNRKESVINYSKKTIDNIVQIKQKIF
jgi:hypothetical protein